MGSKSRDNHAPGYNMSKSLEKALKVQHKSDSLNPMLEVDRNRRHRGIPKSGSKSHRLKQNPTTYPIEVREHFGELTLFTSGGYVYARIAGKAHSLARIVYSLHNPDYHFTSNEKIYHKDADPLNNRIENLTPIREEASGV